MSMPHAATDRFSRPSRLRFCDQLGIGHCLACEVVRGAVRSFGRKIQDQKHVMGDCEGLWTIKNEEQESSVNINRGNTIIPA